MSSFPSHSLSFSGRLLQCWFCCVMKLLNSTLVYWMRNRSPALASYEIVALYLKTFFSYPFSFWSQISLFSVKIKRHEVSSIRLKRISYLDCSPLRCKYFHFEPKKNLISLSRLSVLLRNALIQMNNDSGQFQKNEKRLYYPASFQIFFSYFWFHRRN